MDDERVRALLATAKVIAVVGLSANPERASHQVAWYLHHQGYELYGVNPFLAGGQVFGVPVVASLADVPRQIDIVDVFRRATYTPEVATAAVQVGARALWLQLGIANPQARRIAEGGGLTYVEDRCLKVDHRRLLGDRVR
jgi:uncharacterized protein